MSDGKGGGERGEGIAISPARKSRLSLRLLLLLWRIFYGDTVKLKSGSAPHRQFGLSGDNKGAGFRGGHAVQGIRQRRRRRRPYAPSAMPSHVRPLATRAPRYSGKRFKLARGVPDRYLTFITSYERRNLSNRFFSR